MKAKYKKDGNIEMWHCYGDVWYQETTYKAVVGSNPYLYDSDWDFYGETEVVCEFVLDEAQNMSVEKRNELRQTVGGLNRLLESGSQLIELLIETIKHNV